MAEKEKFRKHFVPRLQCPVASVFVTVVETETKHIRGPLTQCDLSIFQLHFAFSVNEIFMFNFLASQIPGPIFCTPDTLGNRHEHRQSPENTPP